MMMTLCLFMRMNNEITTWKCLFLGSCYYLQQHFESELITVKFIYVVFLVVGAVLFVKGLGDVCKH